LVYINRDENNKNYEAKAYDNIGLILFYKNDPEGSTFYHSKSMEGNFEPMNSKLRATCKCSYIVKKNRYIESIRKQPNSLQKMSIQMADKIFKREMYSQHIRRAEILKEYKLVEE